MGWTDVPWYTICTERFSADFGVDEWFGLNVFLRDGDDVYRTYFLQHGPMVQSIGSVWSLSSLTPYGGQTRTRTCPRAGRRRRRRSGTAVTTSSTSRRRRPPRVGLVQADFSAEPVPWDRGSGREEEVPAVGTPLSSWTP